MRNEEVLHSVKDEMNVLHTVNRRKTNWIYHVLRRRGLIKHAIEGKIEEKIRDGKSRKMS